MSYGNSSTLFDAEDGRAGSIQPDTADALKFQDFGTGETAGQTAGVYDADVAMQRQVGSSSVFSLDYYARFFDVDTMLVFNRAWQSMYPKEDFVDTVLNGAPDLYGPFWLPTTLIFALFFSSSLSSSIGAYLAGEPYSYDFTRLTVAVSTIYVYSFAIPAGLWAVMRYWAGVTGRSVVDVIAIFGYGMTIWIPIAILRFALTGAGYAVSLAFLLRNLYPALATSEQKAARALVLAIAFAHTALAFVLWFSFLGIGGTSFGLPSSPVDVPPDPAPIGDGVRRLLL